MAKSKSAITDSSESIEVSFRPRARIMRTLGQELISNEAVAVVELVKNSFDADAKKVLIRFVGPLEIGKGRIEIIDNGHGMAMGTVYSEWPEENFKEVLYDVSLPLHMTMDVGINDPTAIIWIQPNGSEYRVIDYYEASDANLEHFISVIRSKPYKPPELITGDPAGNARELSSGLSPINIFNKAGYFIRTKVIPNPQIPTQIRMTHGIIKGIYVDKHLTRFRDCMLNYRYPESSEFEGLRNQENEIPIHDEYSHAMRALEYYAVNVKDLPQKQKAKGYESGYQITTHKKTTYKGYRRTR